MQSKFNLNLKVDFHNYIASPLFHQNLGESFWFYVQIFLIILQINAILIINSRRIYGTYAFAIRYIGDRPVGAGGAAATPDKENNLSTRNQMLTKKQFHIGNQFMMPTSLCFM